MPNPAARRNQGDTPASEGGSSLRFDRPLKSMLCPRRWEWFVAMLLVPVAWILHDDFGMAWDDQQHALYGAEVLDYFLSGFESVAWRKEMGALYLYGTLFDMPSALFHRLVGAEDFYRYRAFLMATVGILALPAVAKLGRRLGGERTALFSVLALLAMPQFVGQSFINCKDLPLATAVTWTLLAGVCVAERPNLISFALCGLALGLALSLRIGGIIALGLLLALAGFLWTRSAIQFGIFKAFKQATALPLMVGGFVALILAWMFMVAFWPYAHEDPVGNPLQALRQTTAFPVAYPVLFAGTTSLSNALPWFYLPTMFVLVTPIALLPLCAIGLGLLTGSAAQKRERSQTITAFLVLAWIVVPLLYVIIKRPAIHDGVRLFLFMLPALALASGLGGSQLSRFGFRSTRWLGLAIVATLLAMAFSAQIRWHPYQYAFLNRLTGDRSSLHTRFETDYWATSYRRMAEFISAQQATSEKPLEVLVGLNPLAIKCFTRFAHPSVKVKLVFGPTSDATIPASADYAVFIPRYAMWNNFPQSPVVFEVRREGVLLGWIRAQDRKVDLP